MVRSLPSQNWNKEFRTLRTTNDLVAMVGGLVVRNRLNDHPIVVSTHAVGPPRLVNHLHQLDGTNLRNLGVTTDGWTLNTAIDVTDSHHPLTAADHLLRSSRVRSVYVITTAYQGLFTGWFGVLCKRRTPTTPIDHVCPHLESMARASHGHPAHPQPAVLLISDSDIRTTCDNGKAWLAARGFRRLLRKATKTPHRAAWICGARITFTGVESQWVASVVPCRRSDVLAVARLSRRERTLVQKVASGTSNVVIAEQLGCSVNDIRNELARIEHRRMPGGVPALLRLVEQGWYSATPP